MTNTNPALVAFKTRALGIEKAKRDAAEDMKDLRMEMKAAGCEAHVIQGVMLAVKREFESREKAAKRTAAEEIADMLGSSGDAPLFAAAQ